MRGQNKSYNQRLDIGDRKNILRALGVKEDFDDIDNEGWLTIKSLPIFENDVSFNLKSGVLHDHSKGRWFESIGMSGSNASVDIIDLIRWLIFESNHEDRRIDAIEWAQNVLGKSSNQINLEPYQVPVKVAIHKNQVKYAMLPRCLLRDPSLTPSAKIVWVAIQERCGAGKASSWAGLKKIAEDTGLGKRTVQRALDDLKETGYIVEKKGSGNKRYRYPLVWTNRE